MCLYFILRLTSNFTLFLFLSFPFTNRTTSKNIMLTIHQAHILRSQSVARSGLSIWLSRFDHSHPPNQITFSGDTFIPMPRSKDINFTFYPLHSQFVSSVCIPAGHKDFSSPLLRWDNSNFLI